MIKIFTPALGFDLDSRVAHVATPSITLVRDKGRLQPKNQIRIINSKKESFILTDELMEERQIYPNAFPQFALGESRWSEELAENYLVDDKTDIFNPYLEVFLPIKQTLEAHIDFSTPFLSTLIALWIIGTYIFPIFEAYPYLLVSGTRGSGKSKLLEVIFNLAFNAELTSNTTPSALFRIVGSNLCTVLIDEGEALTGNERNQDLLYILNAGYKKAGVVTRTNKDTH